MFWFLVVCVGVIGAVADIVVSQWSRTGLLLWWSGGALGYLIFMTGLGLVIRMGMIHGFPLTIAVLLAVLVNIGVLALWDVLVGRPFSVMQGIGVVLALTAVACFELGAAHAE